jgi:hypothetical protein
MTPCYVKDGYTAIAIAGNGWGSFQRNICVGCEVSVGMLREEREQWTKSEKEK